MITLVIATRNAHKVEEIRAILGSGFEFKTLTDFPSAPKVIEDANTFAGNAAKKAAALARFVAPLTSDCSSPIFVLADDSGLEVDALKGAPGVHSARFAAPDPASDGNSPDADNNTKLLQLLNDVPTENRTARFRCVIALTPIAARSIASASPVCHADESELQTELFDGACEGKIAFAPTGAKGFGYDPLFVPGGFDQSFAELGEDVKNRMSHRAKALGKLREWFARRQT
ncbi:MAG TPA: non-canonical purine NTP pyrophosphatase [Candidatus Acidoferrum sp.]|nr:non-canonical purine NTP pyrophosphatase [Candidatus Acidoferrum sp.]